MSVRVVLDTNVFVSALISRKGWPGRVLAAAKGDGYTLITSSFQIDELRRVLNQTRLQSTIKPEEADDLFAVLGAVAEVVDELPEVNRSDDPDDNLILATAVAGKADLVVSGDKRHMLAVGNVEGIPIVTAREAADRLRNC